MFGLVSEEGEDLENYVGEDNENDIFHAQSEADKRIMFKHWILNLDVYGSFEPLNPQCYDIQMARSAAFTKLVTMRTRLRKMIEFWEDLSEESGKLMHKLLAQVELIDFYLNKIEFYFSKKQHEDAVFNGENPDEKTDKESIISDENNQMTTISEEDPDLETNEAGTRQNSA